MKKLFLIIISIFLTINSVSALSETEQINAANFLATRHIINDFSWTTDQYKINDNISRKEVMKIIINSYEWYKWDITWTYKCLWKYKDVADDWWCKYIEKSLNEKFIEKWEFFRPDESISISETLKLIFKVKKIEKKYNTWDWWKDYIDAAYDLWWIYDKDIDWTVVAKRWFIFLTLANAGYYFEDHKNWKIEFKENKTDFYGLDFNLKTINSNKYELTWENIPNNINSIEILSCKENFSDIYDSNWYVLKSYKIWNISFKYTIDKNFNNYCLIPYKVKLNHISGETNIVELNLNIPIFRKFTDKNITDLWYPDNINLNTLKKIDSTSSIVLLDKNNLYVGYFWPPEWHIFYSKLQDYLSYKYVWNVLIWDNYAYDFYWKKSIEIDWKTFETYWTWYYKDKDNYYSIKNSSERFVYKIWKNIDILSEKIYIYDWKYYYFDKEFEVWDKNTFKIINNTGAEIWYWYSIFAKDKDNIYFESGWLGTSYKDKFKWDYDTYKVIQSEFNNIWIDKYSIYYPTDNWWLKQYFYSFDLDSLKIEGKKLFSDKNWEYYLDEEIWIIKK